jgi:hypothetical protein
MKLSESIPCFQYCNTVTLFSKLYPGFCSLVTRMQYQCNTYKLEVRQNNPLSYSKTGDNTWCYNR